MVEAYLQLTRAVAVQDAAEEEFASSTRTRSQARFDAAAVDIADSLAVIERLGDPEDRRLAARIERYERRYARDFRRYFGALDAGDEARAEAAEEAADPSSQALQTLVTLGGPEQASESLGEIDRLRRGQENFLRYTLVSVLLGLMVIVALALVLRSMRRNIDDATARELERLEQAALNDSLTGIRNHRAFEEDLARRLAEQRRSGGRLSLVMIDLDGLKVINDGTGHQAGDRAIKAVADGLSDTARASDCVYRIGGDEFAALLPETSAWEAFKFAQRLHGSLESSEVPVRVSAGVTEALGTSTRDGLISQADVALSAAKTGGHDTVAFTTGMERPDDPVDADEDRRHRGTLAAALARAVDAKDSYTRSHSETVAELCAMVATNLGLEGEHVAAIRLAGLVHDVGKIGVPDGILQKPGPLDELEFEVIKTHSVLGHKILHGTNLSREAPWVLHHHERLDGRGYPGGLVGDEIPLESRIIHVADAFEAMTSDRPYRRGMPEEVALAELRRHTGTQFDPQCVEALLAGLGLTPAGSAPSRTGAIISRNEEALPSGRVSEDVTLGSVFG